MTGHIGVSKKKTVVGAGFTLVSIDDTLIASFVVDIPRACHAENQQDA